MAIDIYYPQIEKITSSTLANQLDLLIKHVVKSLICNYWYVLRINVIMLQCKYHKLTNAKVNFFFSAKNILL